MSGVREFAQGTDWELVNVAFDGSPIPVRDLVKFWSPAGCIVEASGDGVTSETIPKRAFGDIPVVYIGGDTPVTPAGATCVIHDASAAGSVAAKELIAMGLESFAFVGICGRDWSRRRKEAFAASLRMNGKALSETDIHPGGKDNKRLRTWIDGLPKPCGLFAASDAIAVTVLSVCRTSGIAVPDDIAIVGVDDNVELCESTSPTLSSIRPDFRQGGRLAARLLARLFRCRAMRLQLHRALSRCFSQSDRTESPRLAKAKTSGTHDADIRVSISSEPFIGHFEYKFASGHDVAVAQYETVKRLVVQRHGFHVQVLYISLQTF